MTQMENGSSLFGTALEHIQIRVMTTHFPRLQRLNLAHFPSHTDTTFDISYPPKTSKRLPLGKYHRSYPETVPRGKSIYHPFIFTHSIVFQILCQFFL